MGTFSTDQRLVHWVQISRHHHPHNVSSQPAKTLVSWLHAAAPSLPMFGNTESIHPKASGPLGVKDTSSQDVGSGPVLAPREALQRLKQGCELQARTQCGNPTRKLNEKGKATEKGPKEEGSVVAHACHLSTQEAE